jgi:hypothetical protein
MDDIQYRLEVIKQDYPTGKLKEWQLQELIKDCTRLREEDPEGPFVVAQKFIEAMLEMILQNLSSVRKLRQIQSDLGDMDRRGA